MKAIATVLLENAMSVTIFQIFKHVIYHRGKYQSQHTTLYLITRIYQFNTFIEFYRVPQHLILYFQNTLPQ